MQIILIPLFKLTALCFVSDEFQDQFPDDDKHTPDGKNDAEVACDRAVNQRRGQTQDGSDHYNSTLFVQFSGSSPLKIHFPNHSEQVLFLCVT